MEKPYASLSRDPYFCFGILAIGENFEGARNRKFKNIRSRFYPFFIRNNGNFTPGFLVLFKAISYKQQFGPFE
ncbi:hypothetical protein [Paraglaciecola arctica]|uniref:Uncharacterized protein n=1 Tax=Paraglaciecola arctica BSs20135 TaxID=493475 RepID=K6ZFK8_9ALTE|nr:hypothetical protein [Paraglaciecola arctica]GAC22200.1 hypothetical protein GARC_5265 [Paraglaciecola arctica BSs20135]